MDEAKRQELQERIVASLKTCYDPEIPVDIYELGLIYDVAIHDGATIAVTMTLTTPHCPVAESLPLEVERRVRDVEGVSEAHVEIVWDPPWNPSMMSEAARLELGFF
jgi:FeS assembly SUF system protein